MFGTIRKHQGWLWAVIGSATILSFVALGPTNAKMGNAIKYLFGGGPSSYGKIAGRSVTLDQRINAEHEIALDTFLKTQQWPSANSIETTRQVYYRLFFIQKLNEMNIKISTEATAAFARRLLGSASMDDFVDKLLKPQGMDAADFERFLRHQLGIEQLVMAAGISGKLATPQEAETMYRLEHQDLDTLLVYFTASNYTASVTVTPQAIAAFYSNQLANYVVPEQVQVSYVKYEVTNFYPSVQASLTNLEQLVAANVERMGTNLFRGAKTPDESKIAIRNEILRQHALVEARRVAGQFADVLDQNTNRTPAGFASLAAKSNLTVRTTAPFDRDYGPQDISVTPDFGRKAFSLTDADPFGGPLMADDGVYIIAQSKRVASRTPPLAEIEAKITADYRYMNAIQLAQQAAVHFDSVLTNGMAAGKSFQAICAQENVKTESLPPFSLSTPGLPENIENRITFNNLKQVAFSTPAGKASPVAGSRDGAFILYVDKSVPMDELKLKTDLPNFITQLRRARQGDAFNQWFNGQVRLDPDFMQALQSLSENAQGKGPAARRSTS